ncbi:hypothetical protein KCU95_g6415, partial [Aureobasidium melanogenum]
MAPRKKKATKKCKQSRATERRSSKPLVEQAMSPDSLTASSTQKPDLIQASMTNAALSGTDPPTTAPAIIESSQKGVAQTQFPLLLLPLEIRVMIYKHVFDDETIVTGPANKNTFTRIYTIDQPQHQYDLALLGTCRSLRAEVNKYVNPRSIIRNISAEAILRHQYGDSPRKHDRTPEEVEIMYKIMKLSVRVNMQRPGYVRHFEILDWSKGGPMSLIFLDGEEPVRALGIADGGWAWLLERHLLRSSRLN